MKTFFVLYWNPDYDGWNIAWFSESKEKLELIIQSIPERRRIEFDIVEVYEWYECII